MKYITSLFIMLISQTAFSQGIAAYTDFQKRFWVFDNGKSRLLEYQPVNTFKTGGPFVSFITNSNHLKVYSNHIDYELSPMVSSYSVTENLVTYKVYSQLFVFENGQKTMLSRYVGQYTTGDSLVAFFDTEKKYFQVYYKGKITTLADGLLTDDAGTFQVGSNIVCFRDLYGNYWLFYQGNLFEFFKTNEAISLKIGRNVLAFIDPGTGFFQTFYNGEISLLESFSPESFQTGYEKVAYVTNTGDFKLFDKGETTTISSFAPEMYELTGDILVYQQQGQLRVYYQGVDYFIENYIPASYKQNYDALVYLDQNGFLQLFKAGMKQRLSVEKINDFQVLNGCILFNEGMNTTKIFYNDKIYQQ